MYLHWMNTLKPLKPQAEKLKSREMKVEWWRMIKKDEGWRMNDEGWWFQAVEGFLWLTDRLTDGRTDICDCRVAFATENCFLNMYTHT